MVLWLLKIWSIFILDNKKKNLTTTKAVSNGKKSPHIHCVFTFLSIPAFQVVVLVVHMNGVIKLFPLASTADVISLHCSN